VTRRRKLQDVTPIAQATAETRRRLDGLAKVAGDMGAWRPAPEVLREVEAVPTAFPQLDAATQVGGWPISRVSVIFGPSAEGKTELLLGVGKGFLERDHFFGFLDLEHTTPPSWVAKLLRGLETHPGFISMHPGGTFEQHAAEVRRFCKRVAKARADGDVPPDTTGLVGVDSIRKLMPADLLKRLSQEVAEGKYARGKRQGVDGIGGRAAQIKAALNAAWMDELVPLLAETRCAVALISREDLDPDDLYADRPKIGGGRALFYDSSMVVRVTKFDLVEEVGGDKVTVGERHIATIYKSKVAGRLEKRPMAAFHTSNGRTAPEGFWVERDVLELAEECGVVELRGSYYGFGKRRLGQGRSGTLRRLHEDRPLFAELERATREATRPVAASVGV
jgi:recombination protein RecA